MSYLPLVSFLFFTALVGFLSYLLTRRDDLSHSTGYFLAGRSLPWIVVAGSLFLTNISAEQITGLNGTVFANGASIASWEASCVLAIALMAIYFLPRYLKSGITTVPQFLELRFGRPMRTISSLIFIYALVIAFLPFVLYAGAITLGQMFDVSTLLGISHQASLWVMVISLGVIGGCYAVFGGLKAVAVSDTINGVGLVIGGLLIPVLGLWTLGGGSLLQGWGILLEESPERMSLMGVTPDAEVPWHTVFTGMFIINVFYWCTNQVIVQRTFGAKNLAEGQKGVLFTAVLKICGVTMVALPGVIAWHMHQRGMIQIPLIEIAGAPEPVVARDLSYPILVRSVLPGWLTGFFGAAMFGAILSSFNSGVNSLSTIFSLDIYKQLIKKQASEKQVVRAGKIFGIGLIAVCILIAPAISQADGMFTLMRKTIAVINVPILAVILMGMLSRRAPALCGYVALPAGIAFFTYFNFVRGNDFFFFEVHWLHTAALNFVFMFTIMIAIRILRPQPVPYRQIDSGAVNIVPWKYVPHCAWALTVGLITLYLTFSPFGILGTGEAATTRLITILCGSAGLLAAGLGMIHIRSKRGVV